MTPAALLVVALGLGGIGLRGSTTCPSVHAVQAELGDLVTNDGELRWVELTSRPEALQLALWSPNGRLEAVRTIALPASCEALARASAVAIATWAVQRSDTGPAPAEAREPGEERIFAPGLLEAERLRLVQSPPLSPAPIRVRGPVISFVVGTLLQLAGPIMWFAPAGAVDNTRGMLASASFVAGSGLLLGGLLWLVGLESAGEKDAGIAF